MINQPKAHVVFFDEDNNARMAFLHQFSEIYLVSCVKTLDDVLTVIEQQEIDVMICAQKVNNIAGTAVLKKVKQLSPETVRILLTGYNDLAQVIEQINSHDIYRYITKPWNTSELQKILSAAVVHAQQLRSLVEPEHKTFSETTKHEKILVIDECAETFDLVYAQFSYVYDITWANTMDKAFYYTKQQEYGVIISDVTLNGTDTSSLFIQLRKQHPITMIMVLTRFHENKHLEGLIKDQTIYRCLPKPVRASLLEMSVQRAMLKYQQLKTQVAMKIAEPVLHDEEEVSQRVLDYINLEQKLVLDMV